MKIRIARGILTTDRRWNYLNWDPKAQTLRPTMPIETGHLAARRAATAIARKLDISLRSAETTELYIHIQRLAGNDITQLILLRIRSTGLEKSPLATVKWCHVQPK